MSTEEKAAYLQKIKAPELLDKLVQAILDEGPETPDAVPAVIRATLDKLYPPAEPEGEYVNVRVERTVWDQLQNVVPEDALAHIKHLRTKAATSDLVSPKDPKLTPRARIKGTHPETPAPALIMKSGFAACRRWASSGVPKIMLLPGDGVGPEVVEQAVRVMDALGTFEYQEGLIGGAAIDATGGNPLPDDTLERCKASDAVVLGAVGGPKWDSRPAASGRPEQGLLKIRKEMNLFANLRPVRLFDALAESCPLRPEVVRGVDMLVVRELTGGLYFGARKEEDEFGTALDTLPYSVGEVERIVRVAALAAQKRSGRILSVDKANVLASSRLWRRVATKVCGEEFPELELSHGLVDSVAMDIIKCPAKMDVLVTENLFGDILSDAASVLPGSLGLLPSASLGVEGKPGMYEPIHGSAPDIAGQGVCNPTAMIMSIAMMFRLSLNMAKEADAIEEAVDAAFNSGLRTRDLLLPGESRKTVGTKEFTDFIVNRVTSA